MAGLRPGRSNVRLELQETLINNKPLIIVHNYGHGGCGVTLCIGCADEAAEIVEAAVKKFKCKLWAMLLSCSNICIQQQEVAEIIDTFPSLLAVVYTILQMYKSTTDLPYRIFA